MNPKFFLVFIGQTSCDYKIGKPKKKTSMAIITRYYDCKINCRVQDLNSTEK